MASPIPNRKVFPTSYIFNHVPKTGGTSLLAICRHNLASSQISPPLTDRELRLDPAQFEPYALITGHFSLPAHTRVSPGRYSMTLLREPIRRVFSGYTFWRRAPENNSLTSKAKELSFAAFVRHFERSPMVILNPCTYHFAGFLESEFPDNSTKGLALLTVAKHNLSAFDFVGICEEYERSARLLCGELGWQLPVPLPHENRTGSEDEFAAIDEQTLEILRERNQLDCELYAYGRKLFEARERTALASAEFQPACQDKPKSFLPFPTPSEQDREARIETVSATWIPDGHSQVLELAVRFRTTVEIPELILGVAIFDGEGNNVWGTNTHLEGFKLQNQPYCDSRAAFVVQCDAPVGIYSVTVALHRLNLFGIHDHWLDGAASFEVAEQAAPDDVGLFKLRQFRSAVESGLLARWHQISRVETEEPQRTLGDLQSRVNGSD